MGRPYRSLPFPTPILRVLPFQPRRGLELRLPHLQMAPARTQCLATPVFRRPALSRPPPAAPTAALRSRLPTPAAGALRSSRPNPDCAGIPAANESGTTDGEPPAHRPFAGPLRWPGRHRSPHGSAPAHRAARPEQASFPNRRRSPGPCPFHPVAPSFPPGPPPSASTDRPAPTPGLPMSVSPAAPASANGTVCFSPPPPNRWPPRNSTPAPPVSRLFRRFF